MCLGAIYWARLRIIYYSSTRADAARIGFDDDFIYKEVALPPELRKIPTIRIVEPRSDFVFNEWVNSLEKKRY
jgi:guanine deaminase